MDLTGTIGLGGFDVLWQSARDARRGAASSQKKMELAGSKDGGWYILMRAEESKMEIPG